MTNRKRGILALIGVLLVSAAVGMIAAALFGTLFGAGCAVAIIGALCLKLVDSSDDGEKKKKPPEAPVS